ncbi:hypothetical protein [Leeuwenhoekiella sp. W20_SRS_FM14]|uniref:hypothetical protein n=1 Tax=Leeuwenhoekiella sp. W20_SRS_FM14 TaxID=3240270 RepID=UPI003F9DDA47
MVIYGWKNVFLKSIKSNKVICPNCSEKATTLFSVSSQHAHVFWIPLFPYRKPIYSLCENCNHALKFRKMPEEFKQEGRLLKTEVKAPIWQYSGLGLIAILISWLIYSGQENKRLNLDYITTPQAGDIYEFKTQSNFYSTLMLTEITKDSVIFRLNDYETQKISGIRDIEKTENYSLDEYSLSREEIKRMYDQGEIIDVNRE